MEAVGRTSSSSFGADTPAVCSTQLVRTLTSQVCTLRFKCSSFVQDVAGSGCQSAPGVIASTQGLPTLGNSGFALTVSGAQAFSYAATLAQFNAAGVTPTVTQLLGCGHIFDLSQDVMQINSFTNGVGSAINYLPIPNSPAFLAMELRTQWAVIDGVGPISGVTLSNGQVIRIGEF